MTLHLHIGVKPADLDKVLSVAYNRGRIVELRGDGWNVWGEGIGKEGNDDSVIHVVLVVTSVEDAREVYTYLPDTEVNKYGQKHVLTSATDYTETVDLELERLSVDEDVLDALDTLRTHAAFAEESYVTAGSSNRTAYMRLLKALSKYNS